MLLFIESVNDDLQGFKRFKYISCYCLSRCPKGPWKFCRIQIHLMLLFIGGSDVYGWVDSAFKYISCYCLSLSMAQFFISAAKFKYISCYCLSNFKLLHSSFNLYSNTSHVIVYLVFYQILILFSKFKYISCYCLSQPQPRRAERLRLFKYISCYCLSSKPGRCSVQKKNSNTSHVIVYQPDRNVVYAILPIQIHLMLLFIGRLVVIHAPNIYSNTSHVIVYQGKTRIN